MAQPNVTVQLGDRSYPIFIQEHGLDCLGQWSEWSGLSHVLIVSNETVFPLYGDQVIAAMQQLNLSYTVHILPDGERYKSWDSAKAVLDQAVEIGLDRKSAVLALGGGVVGDLAGFVAASYMRGIALIQAPTTMLAAVDSSVGGKVAVNHPQAKNIIGFFHQPRAVFMDLSTLTTLPPREYAAGLAEVIKYGVILDGEFFALLEDNVELLVAKDTALLQKVIARCCELKAYVVERDEKESGLRAILNFGHTLGHALESITEYQTYLHGEAVAIGMVYAGELAVRRGLWSDEEQSRLVALIEACGLPTAQSDFSIDQLIPFLMKDKKFAAGQTLFVLPTQIGAVELIRDITLGDLKQLS